MLGSMVICIWHFQILQLGTCLATGIVPIHVWRYHSEMTKIVGGVAHCYKSSTSSV